METGTTTATGVPEKNFMAEFVKFAISFTFAILVLLLVYFYNEGIPQRMFLAVAAMIGAYMAMNIGANDVANNVGPSVGSGAITLGGAIILAAIFEAAGALIAGGDVTKTIRKGIIDPAKITDGIAAAGAAKHMTQAAILDISRNTFLWLMAAALLGGAIWLNVATAVGAPVSTTHSIVGGVVGAGIAAGGWYVVSWGKIGTIVASWFISPIMGGVVAAVFLIIIKQTILYKEDMVSAAKKVVPVLIGVMTMAFVTYLALKGVKNLIKLSLGQSLMIGLGTGVVVWLAVIPMIKSAASRLTNTRTSINTLFTVPLIFAAGLLCFAHGANDVANAVGPLSAIKAVLHEMANPDSTSVIPSKASIAMWIMMIGALGLAVGLATYGPKLVRTVGSEITELDQSRAWSIAMASAIVVIVASWLGLPVSSTHTALGGVFGVGFLRIYLAGRFDKRIDDVKQTHIKKVKQKLAHLQEEMGQLETDEERATVQSLIDKRQKELSDIESGKITPEDGQQIEKIEKEKLLKFDLFYKIIAAWFITVPIAAVLSAILYFTIRGAMLP